LSARQSRKKLRNVGASRAARSKAGESCASRCATHVSSICHKTRV
jgi:hypothetical protein